MARLPPMVSFVAPSGTGKTTLIEGVIAALVARGLRVGVLKHDAHRIELDKPGKDTWRFRRAGAWRAVIVGEEQLAAFSAVAGEHPLAGVVDGWLLEADLVITEGFRRSGLPAVRVHRTGRAPDRAWHPPQSLVAWASDLPTDELRAVEQIDDLPVLPLDGETVAAWLVERFLDPVAARPATGVIPVGPDVSAERLASLTEVLREVCDGRVLAVMAPGLAAPAGMESVCDLRPGLATLGALLTGLAAVDTPDILFLGAHTAQPSRALLEGLLRWGPRATVVVPERAGFVEPTVARYGHRCLGAIQGALLSGEHKLDGWWGGVRVCRVPEHLWRPTDPDGRSFKHG